MINKDRAALQQEEWIEQRPFYLDEVAGLGRLRSHSIITDVEF